ncbi:energy transducer TonB [Nitrosospira lacus]|uniref:Energy transducer TonB n=1 Tax=Nitrosospira lacus TaxID=1288494 RepID=A0A1W6SMV1_9PROT|nr:energy transducer TonB [Nitrosospira lacus]ARO87148.1 energy transducer TonB [Nitrosospira lacus]
MSATPNISDFNSASVRGWLASPSSRLNVTILISVIFHAIVLFGITLKLPHLEIGKAAVPLEVVLVHGKSASKSRSADMPAKTSLDGGGNKASMPLPLSPEHVVAQAEQLEQETEQRMTAVDSEDTYQIQLPSDKSEQNRAGINGSDLVQRSLEIARLEAQTARDSAAYQRPPKRRFIGARTQEYRFARYVEDWRLKVERIGNMNYPEAARREKLYGNLQLTVGIRSDGSLESLEINRSSGKKVLDEAAVRIVHLAGQNGFAPFPPDISRDTDVLHITRTWAFTPSDELTSQ